MKDRAGIGHAGVGGLGGNKKHRGGNTDDHETMPSMQEADALWDGIL